jgi:predicted ATP-grasp superfamily ATP-dependent carboligase
MNTAAKNPLACVMGDVDMVRALGLAGIRCAVVTHPGSWTLHSRYVYKGLVWEDFSQAPERLVDALVHFAVELPEPPILFYEDDAQLLLTSRYRERLAQAFRFVIADPELVENLVDKGRFQMLAKRLGLPVPKTRRLSPTKGSTPGNVDLHFPVIIKPVNHSNKTWSEIGGLAKALQVNSMEDLRFLWPRFVEVGIDLLAQEEIPGPETCIESYHVYVDARGSIAGEFTGRKIRTYPAAYGPSTALTITDEEDVVTLGRALVERLDLQGVAKFDFKRASNGSLHLLEVNPRFNLWHHLGAVAGVNLPALVYADIVGLPRPAVRRARPGTCWCWIAKDRLAARHAGISTLAWLSWVLRCEAKGIALDDPGPFLRKVLARLKRTALGAVRSRAQPNSLAKP